MTAMYDKVEFFRTYFANATEKNILVDLLDKRFRPANDPFTILDLGCHDGALANKIFMSYQARLPKKIKLVGVDPSKGAIQEFLKRNFYRYNTEIEAFVGSAEQYFKDDSTTRYDWVFASQCLYWSKNLNAVVKQINEAGKSALIVMRGAKGIFEIQSTFKHLLGNQNEQLYTARDVEHALNCQGISYQKEDMTTFIQLPDIASKELKWLISFFLQTDENNLADDDFAAVKKFITRNSTQKIQHDVSYFWLGEGRE